MMRRLLFYLGLEIKKGMSFIPFFLIGILFTAAAGIAAAAAFCAVSGTRQLFPKAKVAIVLDSDGSDDSVETEGRMDLKTGVAMGVVKGMDSVKSICEFVMTSPKTAAEGLVDGSMDAAVYLPQGTYEDINTGVNTPVLIRLGEAHAALSGGIFGELIRSGVSYIRSVEASIYAVDFLGQVYPPKESAGAAEDRLFSLYIGGILGRADTFAPVSVSAFGDLTMPEYYGAAAALLVLLLFGVGVTGLYDRGEREVMTRLKQKGLPLLLTSFAKYLALALTLFVMTLVVYFAGGLIVETYESSAAAAQTTWQTAGEAASAGETAEPVAGAAVAVGEETPAGETAEPVAGAAVAVGRKLPQLAQQLPGRISVAVALACALALFMHVLYTLLPVRHAAASYLLIAAVCFVIGGGLIPAAFLPAVLRRVPQLLPIAGFVRGVAILLFGVV